ncbi:MAG: flagellar basal body P-ring formation chaperone FlgA [Rhodocyclaceae bacterium]
MLRLSVRSGGLLCCVAILVLRPAFAYDLCAERYPDSGKDAVFVAAVEAAEQHRQLVPEGQHYRLVPLPVTDVGQGARCAKASFKVRQASGLLLVSVACREGESGVDTYRFELCRQAQVAVSARMLKFGSRVAAADIAMEKRWVPHPDRMPVSELSDFQRGLRSRQMIREGDVLYARMFEPWPDVEKGAPVVVSSDDGLVRIERPARALQSGREGELVQVLTGGGQRIRTKVTGRGFVAAHLGE